MLAGGSSVLAAAAAPAPARAWLLAHGATRGMDVAAGASFAGPTTTDVGRWTPKAPEASADSDPVAFVAASHSACSPAEVLQDLGSCPQAHLQLRSAWPLPHRHVESAMIEVRDV